MQFISQYYSDDEKENNKKEEKNLNDTPQESEEIIQRLENKSKKIEYAPEVQIDHLIHEKEQQAVQKFESGYHIPAKQNHVTGYVNQHTMNDFNFNEQYYTFNSYGYAQDPTDFSQNRIIGDEQNFEKNRGVTVFCGGNKGSKAVRKQMKMNRLKYGDPGKGDFMGPWAINEGEEIFKNMSCGDLTEEQKELMKQMDERRQKKLEEDKQSETKILNVLIIFKFIVLV